MESIQLRGRTEELTALRKWLRPIGEGLGGVALIQGPPGIGKTRLLTEIAQSASAGIPGFTVAYARADQAKFTPLGMLIDAFGKTEPPIMTVTDLAGLEQFDDQRFWLLDRLRTALENRSNQRPVLVLVDDLQWADPATIWAIGALATQLSKAAVGWVIAYRRVPDGSEASALLAKLSRLNPLHLTLKPLPQTAAEALAADVLGVAPDTHIRGTIRRAGGNPFYIIEAARAVRGEGLLDPAANLPGLGNQERHGPALARLGAGAQQLLKAAAIFGRSFHVADVADLIEQPVSALLPAVEELCRIGVLVDEGEHTAFAHDLLWQAVYDNVPFDERRTLHRKAARNLLAAGAAPLDVAGHLMGFAEPGDAEAVQVLACAARDAIPQSPDTASDLYLKVIDLLRGSGRKHTEAILEAIPVLADAGRMGEMRRLAEEAFAAGIDPDDEATIRSSLSVATGLRQHVEPAPTQSALLEARRGLARYGLPAGSRAHLTAIEALWLMMLGRIDEAIQAGRTAVSAGERTGRGAAVVTGLTAQALALRLSGRFGEALDLLQQATSRAKVGPSSVLLLQPARWYAGTLSVTDHFDEAETEFARVRREMSQLGVGALLHMWHVRLSGQRLALGRLDDAEAEAEAAIALADEFRTGPLVATARAVLARVALLRGDLAQAHQQMVRAPSGGDSVYELEAFFARGLVAEAAGDAARALEVMAPVWSSFAHHFGLLAFTPTASPHLVRIALRAGCRDMALRAADAAVQLANLNPSIASVCGAAAHATGLLRHDPDSLETALEHLRVSGRPIPYALAHEDAAAAALARGRQDAGIAHLTKALDTYERIDATGFADRVRTQLHSLGGVPSAKSRTRPRTGWSALSVSELQIARFVAVGLTNRAIADRLELSRHTVDSHLGRMFIKLHISSRSELARVAAERFGVKNPPKTAVAED